MKREAMGNTKMKLLCKALDLPTYAAAGLLECLWHLTARETPRGDIGKLKDEEIALALDWDGNSDELITALVASRWLDACSKHRLIVHDWSEHADEATKKKLQRNGLSFASRHVETFPDDVATCSPTSARASTSASAGKTGDSAQPSGELVDQRAMALQIVCAHPRSLAVHLLPGEVRPDDVAAVNRAVAKEARRSSGSVEVAAAYLLVTTQGYAAAAAQWPPGESQFMPSVVNFFDKHIYRQDPKEWKRGTDRKQNGKHGSGNRTAVQQRHDAGLNQILDAFPELAGSEGDGHSDGPGEGELRDAGATGGMGRGDPVTLDGHRGTTWHGRPA